MIHNEYKLVYNQYKQWLLDWYVEKYTKELYSFAL